MTVNEFLAPGFGGVGAGVVAFDRVAMLAGLPATAIRFEILQEGGLLPSDLDGLTPPPPGSPNYVLTFDTDPPRLSEWRFHADFATPANSTLTGPIGIPISSFDVPVCGDPREACIPQLDSERAPRGPRRPAHVPPRLSQLRRSRIARHELHGQRGGPGIPGGRPLVRGPRPERGPACCPPGGNVRAGREPPLHGLDRDGRRRQHRPRLQQVGCDDVSVPRGRRPSGRRRSGDPRRRGRLSVGNRQPDAIRAAAGAITAPCRSIRPTTARSGSRASTTRRRARTTGTRASRPSGSPAARPARPASWRASSPTAQIRSSARPSPPGPRSPRPTTPATTASGCPRASTT